ncbi:MAG: AsmA family protein [Desulfobacterales bacterium]|nr:AsmA family protein [Desulfobacterales bacterium]
MITTRKIMFIFFILLLLSFSASMANTGDINLEMSCKVINHDFFKNFSAQGHIQVNSEKLIEFINRITSNSFSFGDTSILSSASFESDFKANYNSLYLDNINLKIDSTLIKGFFVIENLKKPSIKFKLKGNQIDIDKYISISNSINQKQTVEKDDKQKENSKNDSINKIKNISFNGILEFDLVKFHNLEINNFFVDASAEKGIISLAPVSGGLYGGKYLCNFNADFSQKDPAYLLNLKVENVAIHEFIKALSGNDKISGNFHAYAALISKGLYFKEIISNLNGNSEFLLNNGKLKGMYFLPSVVIDEIFSYMSNLGKNDYSKEEFFKERSIKRVRGILKISDGVIENNDFIFIADFLEALGKGKFDIAHLKADYALKIDISGFPIIPIFVKGPVSDINVSLDRMEFTKNTAIGVVKAPLNLSKEVLNLGTSILDKGITFIDKGSDALGDNGASKVGKGVLSIGKGILDVGKGVLDVGKDIIDGGKNIIKKED